MHSFLISHVIFSRIAGGYGNGGYGNSGNGGNGYGNYGGNNQRKIYSEFVHRRDNNIHMPISHFYSTLQR